MMDIFGNSFLLLLTLFCGNVNSLVQCPNECHCMNNIINCTSPSFPMQLPPRNISQLSIDGDIQNIPKNAIVPPKGGSVDRVIINSNHIGEIESFAFQGKYSTFYINSTKITKINPMAFSNIDCQGLLISHSTIDILPRFTFKDLRCQLVSLSRNNIAVIDTEAFFNITNELTNIEYNNISYIKAESLPINGNLTIYGNNINYFGPQNADFDFYGNKILCKCSLDWILSKKTISKKSIGRNHCSGPPELMGRSLKELNKTVLCNRTVSTSQPSETTLPPSQPSKTTLPPSQPKTTPNNTPKTFTWNILLTIIIFAIAQLILNILA